MSKSKNNGVDPQALIELYGADTARLFMMFAAPPEATLEWSDSGVDGAHRFLKRLWSFAAAAAAGVRAINAQADDAGFDWSRLDAELTTARRTIHEVLKQAVFDFSKNQYNTVVAGCMKILNAMQALPEGGAADRVRHEGLSIVVRLLSPVAPHICHVLWRELGYGADVLSAQWPEVDPAALARDEIELVVQVNGKLRGKIVVPADADQDTCRAAAVDEPNVQRHLEGKTLRKAIVVPGKLINLVVA